jgi:hypothetical protein
MAFVERTADFTMYSFRGELSELLYEVTCFKSGEQKIVTISETRHNYKCKQVYTIPEHDLPLGVSKDHFIYRPLDKTE